MRKKTHRGTTEVDHHPSVKKREMEHLKKKYHVSDEQIKNAIAAVGNDIKRVEDFLKDWKSYHIHRSGNINKSEKADMQGMQADNDTHAISNPQNKISGLHQLQKREN